MIRVSILLMFSTIICTQILQSWQWLMARQEQWREKKPTIFYSRQYKWRAWARYSHIRYTGECVSVDLLTITQMQIIKTLPTPRQHHSWKNSCEYVVLHHTATWESTFDALLNAFDRPTYNASFHYLVREDGAIAKIGNDSDILWHAWVSEWKGKENMNKYSIWIEIIGPLKDGWFTNAQMEAVEELVFHLCEVHGLKKDRVIRHKDISPGRKSDLSDIFWNKKFKTYSDWIDSIFFIQSLMSKFSQALKDEQVKTPGIALITKFEWDQPLTEWETRELLEIGLLRLYRLLKK